MVEPILDDAECAERRLDVAFRDKSLLRRALRHASVINERPELTKADSNERLALLGDAVLSHSIALSLVNRHPGAAQGPLTQMRQELVNRNTLAEVAVELKLGQCLEIGKGAEQMGGRENTSILEGALEAVIGAIELDQGFSASDAFVQRVFGPRLERRS